MVMGLGLADDTVAAYIEEPGGTAGILMVCSAYLPGDTQDPTTQLSPVIDYVGNQRIQLILGSDCNSHHTSWGSTDVNSRAVNKAVKTVVQLELTVGELEHSLNDAYLRSCPVKKTSNKRNVPWWNGTLTQLRKETRALFNRAKRDGNWDAYRTALTTFNRELRKVKRRSWARFCEEVNNTSQTSRLYKVISKAPSSHPSTLKRPDGTYTKTAEETLRLLADVHFSNSIHLENHEAFSHTIIKTRPSVDDWRRASVMFKPDRVTWVIDSFKPYKTGGEDNIFPAFLQQGKDIILPMLLKIFRASFAWGYIPLAWTKVRVSYIPKSGDRDKALPKSYSTISLTSFMLKTMEKVVNLHIRDTYLTKTPLHER
ncbi:uncharacterized protein LOC121728097 [Aricia agestis]|uniref:uncharacterized protein LOC121728097 n=1 Tax=Aricia agestis TaxID=91739 RepID=UPI001C20A4DC|nr:uncharacterized protein LOC121728097 [Aricia agestis]